MQPAAKVGAKAAVTRRPKPRAQRRTTQKPVPAGSYSCGSAHTRQIEEVLRLRYPGAAHDAAVDVKRAPRFSRALVIEDFIRLRAAPNVRMPSAFRYIEPAFLELVRDSGRVTPEVCEVVRFMHEYYIGGGTRAVRQDRSTRARR